MLSKLFGITLLNSFGLHQNYPNPFNPSTIIRFDLERRGFVDLSVYDVLGRKVTALVNNTMAPGRHEVEWIAADVKSNQIASGIYFYRLESGNHTQVRKMVLLR